MKYPLHSPLALACVGVLSIALSPTAHAEFKCDQSQLTRVDATACAKAAEGPASLRQYVSRTQKIYGLQMSDYLRFVGDERHAAPVRVKPQSSVVGVAVPLR